MLPTERFGVLSNGMYMLDMDGLLMVININLKKEEESSDIPTVEM